MRCPTKFMPEMPPRYDGAADPPGFLLAYEEAVLEAGVMTRSWPTGFPWPSPASHAPGCSTSLDPRWHPGGNSTTSSLLATRYRRTTQSRPCWAALKHCLQIATSSRSSARLVPLPSARGLRRVGLLQRPTSPSAQKTTRTLLPTRASSQCSARPPSATWLLPRLSSTAVPASTCSP